MEKQTGQRVLNSFITPGKLAVLHFWYLLGPRDLKRLGPQSADVAYAGFELCIEVQRTVNGTISGSPQKGRKPCASDRQPLRQAPSNAPSAEQRWIQPPTSARAAAPKQRRHPEYPPCRVPPALRVPRKHPAFPARQAPRKHPARLRRRSLRRPERKPRGSEPSSARAERRRRLKPERPLARPAATALTQ